MSFFLQWKKYWFVLTDHSLRYYKDSIAEEVRSLLLFSTSLGGIVGLSWFPRWPLCFPAGFRPGWRDWPVDLLQCDGVPGSAQLRLPNTRERPWLLLEFVFNTAVFVFSGFYQRSCATRILLPPLTGRCVFCGDKLPLCVKIFVQNTPEMIRLKVSHRFALWY